MSWKRTNAQTNYRSAAKNKLRVLILIAFLFSAADVFGQREHSFFQAGLSGLFGPQKSVYQNGHGINTEQLWAISPSFNLGPELSFYSNRSGGSDLQALSTQFDVYYFPKKLMERITKKESPFLNGFYFCAGIGHNFKTGDVFDDIVLNTSHFGLGYNFSGVSSSFYVSLSANNFALHPGFTDEQVKNNFVNTVTVGITLFEKKVK